MQVIIWQIILFLVPIALGAAKDLLQKIMQQVKDAEAKTDLTGSQKKDLVITQIKSDLDLASITTPAWVINTLIEISVSYFKTK